MMKKRKMLSLAISLLITGILVFSCGSVENPEVKPENVFSEGDSYKNESIKEAEKTNLSLNGKDWVELSGKYDHADDKDFFELKVEPSVFEGDTSYFIKMVAITEKGPLSKIYATGFPCQAYSYKEDGAVVNHLAVGLGGGIRVQEGTVRVVFKTNGKAAEGGAESMYTGGKIYSMKLK